jgi:ATP-dependent exoDNAse (exonuclease V) alpha subunit
LKVQGKFSRSYNRDTMTKEQEVEEKTCSKKEKVVEEKENRKIIQELQIRDLEQIMKPLNAKEILKEEEEILVENDSREGHKGMEPMNVWKI